MKSIGLILLSIFFASSLQLLCQSATLSGVLKDIDTKEALFGAYIIYGDGKGTTTEPDGSFKLTLESGDYSIKFSYYSYKDTTLAISLQPGENKVIELFMEPEVKDLAQVTIISNLYKKELSKEVQSVGVITTQSIENRVSPNLTEALKTVTGLQVIDGQPTIRGGSGYAYGAGSRVMIVVDGLPMLSADRGDVQWNFIPIENASQIEVVKGSSSVIYGASALNGVVNVSTFDGMETPYTALSMYHKIIGPPKRKITQWWDVAPQTIGAFFIHRQRVKQLDLVLGGNLHSGNSHLVDDDEQRARFTWKTRYRMANVPGLSFGINGNYTKTREGYFVIWQDANQGIMKPSGGTSGHNDMRWVNIDPWVTYFDKYKNQHSLKTRYYRTQLGLAGESPDYANLYVLNYQYSRRWIDKITTTGGYTFNGFETYAEDYGSHTGYINALFGQGDFSYKKMALSVGARLESFIIDKEMIDPQPSFRGGINMGPWNNTTFRFSFGQGYRIPSFVEKYIRYEVGGLINIFPNPVLKPEYGWSSEIGMMKSIRLGKGNGFFDASLFLNEYKDMVEFSFNIFPEEPGGLEDQIGFKSLNISEARIAGLELGFNATNTIGKLPYTFTTGYTYLYPVDLNYSPDDTTIRNYGVYVRNFFNAFSNASDSVLKPILKYRFRHSATADLEIDYKKWKFGGGVNYYSFMEHVDSIFEGKGPFGPLLPLIGVEEPIPGLRDWRENHNGALFVTNFRISYNFNEHIRLLFKVENLTNEEYAIRPAMLEAPRNYTLQYKLSF